MINRSSDVFDTFRICISNGYGDPMAIDGNNRRTVFYHHNGTVEQLKFLLDQEIFFIDVFGESNEGPCVLNDIHRLRFDFFELIHERVCTVLESITCGKLQWYKIRYLRRVVEMSWNTISDDASKLLRLANITKTMVLRGAEIHELDYFNSRRRPNNSNVTHLFWLILGSSGGGARLTFSQDDVKTEGHQVSAAVIHAWLLELWEAGVDLESYLKEDRLAEMRRAEDESFPWAPQERVRPLYDFHFTYGKHPIDCSVVYKTIMMHRKDRHKEASFDEFLGTLEAIVPGAWIEDQ